MTTEECIGARVVRGPDWMAGFGNQDGGEGHVGTIVSETDSCPQQCVAVQWDTRDTPTTYRAGHHGCYDLRIYDNASTGVKHDCACTGCQIPAIFGILWICDRCPDVRLCSECYFGDKHALAHRFVRRVFVRDRGTLLPPRDSSTKVRAIGAFEKSKVVRGPDWQWGNQDGGNGNRGEIITVVNFSPATDRDAVEVTWDTGFTNVYRLGYKGKLDVKCVGTSPGGHYYVDHIPALKLDTREKAILGDSDVRITMDWLLPPAEDPRIDVIARYKPGDNVRIEIDIDLLKTIEKSRGTWNKLMIECVGLIGTVVCAEGEDVTADFGCGGVWQFHEASLSKTSDVFSPGDVVQVVDNLDRLVKLQDARGGWNDMMTKVLGKKGLVELTDEDGDIKVAFGDYSWTFNPECIAPATGHQDTDVYTRDDILNSSQKSDAVFAVCDLQKQTASTGRVWKSCDDDVMRELPIDAKLQPTSTSISTPEMIRARAMGGMSPAKDVTLTAKHVRFADQDATCVAKCVSSAKRKICTTSTTTRKTPVITKDVTPTLVDLTAADNDVTSSANDVNYSATSISDRYPSVTSEEEAIYTIESNIPNETHTTSSVKNVTSPLRVENFTANDVSFTENNCVSPNCIFSIANTTALTPNDVTSGAKCSISVASDLSNAKYLKFHSENSANGVTSITEDVMSNKTDVASSSQYVNSTENDDAATANDITIGKYTTSENETTDGKHVAIVGKEANISTNAKVENSPTSAIVTNDWTYSTSANETDVTSANRNGKSNASEIDTNIEIDTATTKDIAVEIDTATTKDTAVDVDTANIKDTAVDVDTATTTDSTVEADTDTATTKDTTVDVDTASATTKDTAVYVDTATTKDTVVDVDTATTKDTADNVYTATTKYTAVDVDTASATTKDTAVDADTATTKDTAVDVDSATTKDTTVDVDTVYTKDTTFDVDTATTKDTAVDVDTASATTKDTTVDADTANTKDTAVDVDTATTKETAVDVDTANTKDTAVDVNTATRKETNVDVDTATTKDNTVDVDTATATTNDTDVDVDIASATTKDTTVDVYTDTATTNDTTVDVDTASATTKDTTVDVDTATTKDTAVYVDTATMKDTAVDLDTATTTT